MPAAIERLPSRRIHVIDVPNADTEIRAFLGRLKAEGVRPWCEVFFPAPTHLTGAERDQWLADQDNAFDAVEMLEDGTLVTLPPYTELLEGAD